MATTNSYFISTMTSSKPPTTRIQSLFNAAATTTTTATGGSRSRTSSSFFRSQKLPNAASFWFSWKKNKLSPVKIASAWPSNLYPPPIDLDFLESLEVVGATVSEEGVIETFDNDAEAFDTFFDGVVVSDLSHFGRIRVSGDDRIQFLHGQTTANFECLVEGQGCDTVLVTPTARTIDLAYAWIMKSSILLVVSSETCDSITQMLNKYIFFSDKVEIEDITKKTSFFTLAGPHSNQIMANLNLKELIGQPYGTHRHYAVNGIPVTVGVGSIISSEGYSLLTTPAAAESIWKAVISQGATPMGSKAWETLRIFQGRPVPGKELTNEFNVLEAGLWNSISLNKGCYKGQETISRLITYDGVKQKLCRLHLSAPAEPGCAITVNHKKVGKLTSCTSGIKDSQHYGLGYIKKQHASNRNTVIVGDEVTGTIEESPFLACQLPPSKTS